jgi:NAD(P)-dependent dehydrogenase (short-subunit alcohol dehydrogenase family)
MKPFGVRVAIVEPGIIDTAMVRRNEESPDDSVYPYRARLAALFRASLKNPVPPSVVAQKILEIAESGTWRLRHPVGPDAIPFLQWRNKLTDEEWVELFASDDETWRRSIERDFGLVIDPQAA